MTVVERRIVKQEWYETEWSKTGWDTHGWVFENGELIDPISWMIVENIKLDKFGNPYLGIAEREIKI